jgi:hypothetical protein
MHIPLGHCIFQITPWTLNEDENKANTKTRGGRSQKKAGCYLRWGCSILDKREKKTPLVSRQAYPTAYSKTRGGHLKKAKAQIRLTSAFLESNSCWCVSQRFFPPTEGLLHIPQAHTPVPLFADAFKNKTH